MFDPSLENNLRCLSALGRAELCERWRLLLGTPPPKGIAARLLVHAIAYEMQAKHYGGLKPVVRTQLRHLTDHRNRQPFQKIPPLKPGHRLVREWNSKTYVVDVVDEGFEWEGVRYASLSQIARAITGTQWSGPRFFGLVTRSAS